MIKVSIFYAQSANASFDMDYYVTKHMPMVRDKLGSACKGMAIDQGIGGGAPGTPPTYVAIGHFLCESVQAFQAAFAPHAKEIMADIPKYTKIQPIIQFSEVKV
jgi:uncharacterized protein (TIGR02118 family)